jgi:aspartate carbamoyltransferase catalytic subunit
MKYAKSEMIVMHPLPRRRFTMMLIKITSNTSPGKECMFVRMALLVVLVSIISEHEKIDG